MTRIDNFPYFLTHVLIFHDHGTIFVMNAEELLMTLLTFGDDLLMTLLTKVKTC
jgi:hypothetical protein